MQIQPTIPPEAQNATHRPHKLRFNSASSVWFSSRILPSGMWISLSGSVRSSCHERQTHSSPSTSSLI